MKGRKRASVAVAGLLLAWSLPLPWHVHGQQLLLSEQTRLDIPIEADPRMVATTAGGRMFAVGPPTGLAIAADSAGLRWSRPSPVVWPLAAGWSDSTWWTLDAAGAITAMDDESGALVDSLVVEMPPRPISATWVDGSFRLLVESSGQALGMASIRLDGSWGFSVDIPLPEGWDARATQISPLGDSVALVERRYPFRVMLYPVDAKAGQGNLEYPGTLWQAPSLVGVPSDSLNHWKALSVVPIRGGVPPGNRRYQIRPANVDSA